METEGRAQHEQAVRLIEVAYKPLQPTRAEGAVRRTGGVAFRPARLSAGVGRHREP